MPLYLTRFSYTPATWAKLIKNPEDRRAAAKQYIESVGGKLHGFWYAFGDHDGYNLWEAPDNVSMAATAMAIGAGGALSSIQTTVLMSVEETLAALQKASTIAYRPPGTGYRMVNTTQTPSKGRAKRTPLSTLSATRTWQPGWYITYVKDNPKRPGTKGHAAYARGYAVGLTIAEAKALAPWSNANIDFDIDAGYIAVSPRKPVSKPAVKLVKPSTPGGRLDGR